MATDTTVFDQAAGRVATSEVLAKYRYEFIEYDWNQGDEHYEWVAKAPEAELLDWANRVRADD